MPFPEALNVLQFAQYIKAIQKLYATDEDFRSLCDDYITSKTNMENLVGISFEYQQLAIELEKEILVYLQRTNSKSNDQS